MDRDSLELRSTVTADGTLRLNLEKVSLPEPGPGQVLVRVEAAPINPSDVLTLTGEYGMLPPLPAIGGNEGVGRVEQLGDGVTNVKVGQTVLLPVGCGTWVTHLHAPAAKLIPEAMAAAKKIAEKSMIAVLAAKEAVNRAYETTLREGVLFERRTFQALFATEDQKEGMSAFLEKRAPQFRDR